MIREEAAHSCASLRTQLDKAVDALEEFVAAYRATEGGSKRGDDACSKAVSTLLQIKGEKR